MNAVVFGAGGVGLGFLGELLTRSEYQPAFVDIDDQVIRALQRQGSYTFNKVGEGVRPVAVRDVRAIYPERLAGREAVVAAVARAQIVFTAAGARALPSIGAALAQVVQTGQLDHSPVNVLCCENHRNAALALRQATEDALADDAAVGDSFRFVNTVVARMCQRLTTKERNLPPITPDSDVVIVAEDYDLLPADGSAAAEPTPQITGLEFLAYDKFEAWDTRKLFAHNGVHALLAVLGRLKGYRYFYEAGEDPEIDAIARGMLWEEVGPALVHRFAEWFSTAEHDAFAHDLYGRVISRDFADTLERGVRNSIRMISSEDGRLSRAAQFVAEQGISPYRLCLGIAGVLHLNEIAAADIHSALEPEQSGLTEDIVGLVGEAYQAISGWQSGHVDGLSDFAQGGS